MPSPTFLIASIAAIVAARHDRQAKIDAYHAWELEQLYNPVTPWGRQPAHGKSLAEIRAGVDDPDIPWLVFEEVRDVTHAEWGTVLTDVMQHLDDADAKHYTTGGESESERGTDIHEGTHGINFSLRYGQQEKGGFELGAKVSTLYVLDDRYVMLLEPPMSKAEVAARVPVPLRAFRYQLYVAEQEGWNDRPLYLFDEWVAYTNDTLGMIERDQLGFDDGVALTHDSIQAALEFSVYALATMQAISEEAPEHWRDHPALAAFGAWNLRRCFELWHLGGTLRDFAWTDSLAYMEELRTGKDAAKLREFARKTWGEAWTQEVMGF
jgi:hypothetical protein